MPAPSHLIFTGQMFFLMPNQQCQSSEGSSATGTSQSFFLLQFSDAKYNDKNNRRISDTQVGIVLLALFSAKIAGLSLV